MSSPADATFIFRLSPPLAATADELARRAGMNRSAYLRRLIQQDALRMAQEPTPHGTESP